MIDWKPQPDPAIKKAAKLDRIIATVCTVLLVAWVAYAFYKDVTLWDIL